MQTRFFGGSSPNPAARKILWRLRKEFRIQLEEFASLKVAKKFQDAFRTLVVTILSQSSTDTNALKAFERLEKLVGVSPKSLAQANVATIERAIEIGGLQHTKARALKQLALVIQDKFQGSLVKVLDRPLDEAREMLMSLPKVGPKTADVLLVSLAGKPTIPVDTHVNRVSRRLGLAPLQGGYEDVRQSLQSLYPPKHYHQVHLLLIAHGRRYCTARRPVCPICPVKNYCLYPQKTEVTR